VSRPPDTSPEETSRTSGSPDLGPIFEHIDAHFDEYVARIQRYLQTPGISTTGEGMRESAELSRELMEEVGAVDTELVETDGNPVVFGRMSSKRPGAKTLIASSLYDLVPVDPDEWVSPPFAAEVVDNATARTVGVPAEAGDVIVARGAANQRGPSLAFMLALEAIEAVTGDLPANIMFSLDGEEEIASPHWRQFLRKKESELATADAAFQHGFRTNENGRHLLHCGFKGLSLFELTVRGGPWGGTLDGRDLWAADMVWVHSPIQKLIEALDAVLDGDGVCKVPGFYDGIAPRTPEEDEIYDRLRDELDLDAAARSRNIPHFRSHRDPRDLFVDLISGPILNIDGLVSGYTEAFTTVMPMKATAKFDLRIVPDQSADRFFENLRTYLDDLGLDMVEIDRVGGTEPGKTSPSHPLVRAADRAGAAHGVASEVWPISAAANPLGMYARAPFDLPILFAGLGRSGNYHVPNEWCSVEGIRESMKWAVTFLHEWAG
jgi:acetylornithine deacetylase/succinyl-diaminopimelate desuccinylase-like protein